MSCSPPTPDEASPSGARVHGGLQDAELEAHGLRPDDVLDFSASTNPYGPAPAMLRALADAAIGGRSAIDQRPSFSIRMATGS